MRGISTSIINEEFNYDNLEKDFIDVDLTSSYNVNSKLDSFAKLEASWDGPDSLIPLASDIDKAKEFIALIPPGFPLPKAMLSKDGTIGLYWDDDHRYVDIQFESDHTLSIFSRDRSSGREKYIDSIDVVKINLGWYFDTLGKWY